VRIVTTLMLEMSAPDCQGVMVLAATNRIDSIDPALRRPGRFDTELEVGVASPAERLDIMRCAFPASSAFQPCSAGLFDCFFCSTDRG